ncbi:galactose/glucose ABC transporter substrate-binding protein MglB [Kingella negevensis]|uniref:D-galactose/methyl-galactoside binding periplasmic protein MglB n=1 Tax=Kingella negevensis TaxID=1522312 RepID=A0A238HH32_9NEIS|nr:galactose/glucose ABC transporter substrate-binding protein MglB [Kingella negevensis]MDK4684018.1 galactose/glucose ABC transporter substrate-binding protein MglB [Kingella negevensis]MDK4698053.1 galactose/glucose ABC transporter substrate-binding protein MglB [Kingella negevensis]MDK4707118.1 galactose/glucose ABC transporter substrate-binding protein MglB [Kingella negevensis]MDK4710697.1 galactose/glucose ABC transporter substrate-binding protein MglB [Kingella negevensis]SNB80853.1 D-
MKFQKTILVSAMAAVLGLAACGGEKAATPATPESGASGAAAAPAGDPVKVGVTIYKYDDNFMSLMRKALENEAATQKTAELLLNDSQNSQSTQNDQVDILISKGVKVLAINLVDPSAAPTIISKAQAANIPVIFFNKDPGDAALKTYDKAYFIGTNPQQSGEIQGQLIGTAWKAHPEWDLNKDGVIDYVLLKGEPGHPDAEARTKFVAEKLQADGFKLKQLQLDTGMWDAAKAKDIVQAWLAGPTGKQIEVVISNNDAMAMGAVEAMKAQGKVLPTFGVDALPEALQMVKADTLAGTVLNDGDNQAKAVYALAVDLGNGKDPKQNAALKLEANNNIRIPYVGVDKNNLSQFLK